MAISMESIKDIRSTTGAGIADCKKALKESDGDMEKAVEFLRKKGLAAAAKKAGRIASEGLVHAYIHGGGRVGVLVEINCETDFVSATDDFNQLIHDVALHIAAFSPTYVKREEVPEAVVAKEIEIYNTQALESGKPEHIVQKISEGRLNKWYGEVCLLEQAWVKDSDRKVLEVLNEAIAKIGENISVRRFVRYNLGEGLAKREDDLAAEVAKQIEGNK
jgi:elongation factor Ts